jgi:hypothetical protein
VVTGHLKEWSRIANFGMETVELGKKEDVWPTGEAANSNAGGADNGTAANALTKGVGTSADSARRRRADDLLLRLEEEYAVLVGQWTSDVESWRKTGAFVLHNHIAEAEDLFDCAITRKGDIYLGNLASDVCRYRRASRIECATHRWTRSGRTYVDGKGFDMCPRCDEMCGCTVEEADAYALAAISLGVWDSTEVGAFKQRVLKGLCCPLE